LLHLLQNPQAVRAAESDLHQSLLCSANDLQESSGEVLLPKSTAELLTHV